MTQKECNGAMETLTRCYDATRERGPRETITAIVGELGLELTKELFAIIVQVKKHDGRISDVNKNAMELVPLNQEEWKDNKAVICEKLDYIHPTHIDQIVTELRNYKTGY